MKTKILSVILAVVMVISTFPLAFAAEAETVILYTNDVHCAIDDYAILAAYKAQLEAEGKTVIAVDAGDAIQGEVIGTLTQGEAIVDIMNSVGYDYAVPGNHEYDYGMETFLDIAETKAEYEYISSNFYDLSSISGVFKPYAIKDIGDYQIAFVGITTPETVSKANPEYFKDENGNIIYGFPTYDMEDGVLYENVQKSVDNAIADGADIVVAVGHLGILETTDGWKSTDVIANTNGIDCFIDAHSHETIESATYKNKDNEDVALSSTGTKFANFGQLTIKEDGTPTFELINPDEVNVDTMSDDAKEAYNIVKAKIDGYDEQIAYLYEIIGTSEAELIAYDDDGSWAVRKRETNAGNFVADAYRAVTGADVALSNGGGIRNEIPVGDVTRKMLMDMNPWNNKMCVLEITGQQLIDILEHGARSCPDSLGGFFQVSGVTFEINTWTESPVVTDINGNFISIDETMERRVANVLVGGKPVDLDAKYTIAGTEYVLTSGGDGLTMLEDARVVQQEGLLCDSEMLIKYFTENLNGKITAEQYGNPDGDGRIKINATHTSHTFPDGANCICGAKRADYSGYNNAYDRYVEISSNNDLNDDAIEYIREKHEYIIQEHLDGRWLRNNYSEEEQYILDALEEEFNDMCDALEEGIADGTYIEPDYTEIEAMIADFKAKDVDGKYEDLIIIIEAELEAVKATNPSSAYEVADSLDAIEEKIDLAENCEHLCHKDGFPGFIWKIVCFIFRILDIQQYCDCGSLHY
ncbi:MAG: bifunctional metallophosphatase/5'-nucleotidase [Clostridia bacterium]|nr:bifunctional metallophosphatase/5'-nucleotidase [Clostridia bacterium]